MNKVENQISRMKSMMTYGLTTEGKDNQYKSVEYQREGADGKTYGIVREGTKFYIKVSDKKKNVLKEDFDYIGGFRNRKDNEYTSYANALKHFDMKMIGLNEASKNKKIVIESWNPDRKEELAVEATEKMRREIERQRQIMGNVNVIEENKNYSVNLTEDCCKGKSCNKVDKDCMATQKDNIKKIKDGKGGPSNSGGDPYTQSAEAEMKKMQKTNIKNGYKPVMSESEQVLGWNENPDYIDTSHGTEVGDDAPFTEGEGTEKEMKNGTVEEGVAMHKEGENQNSPSVGTGEIGDDAPFDKPISEAAEDDDLDDVEDTDLDSDDEDFDDEDIDLDSDEEFGDDDLDDEDFESEDVDNDFESEDSDEDFEDNDLESRLSTLEDLVMKIADKLGVDSFEDDDLYDDSDDEDFDDSDDSDEEFGDEDDEFDDSDDDFDEDDDFDDDDTEVFESKSYRKMMVDEDRLDYFGKHPAYRKEPMRLPSNRHQEMKGYDDINDDSVESESPFGEKIGDGTPFEISPEDITNAIAESIQRNLKKKI